MCVQDKRVIEQDRLDWDMAAYEARRQGPPASDLATIREDLKQQRRWSRAVWHTACVLLNLPVTCFHGMH